MYILLGNFSKYICYRYGKHDLTLPDLESDDKSQFVQTWHYLNSSGYQVYYFKLEVVSEGAAIKIY